MWAVMKMKEEEIIKLWKLGYSRSFIYEEEFKILYNHKYANLTNRYKLRSQIRQEAKENVDKVLLIWYRKEVSGIGKGKK